MKYDEDQLPLVLTDYIANEIVASPGIVLRADDDLLEDSLVNSVGIMRLVAFIEQEFGFAVPAQDVTVENFSTVNAIVEYLRPKLRIDVE